MDHLTAHRIHEEVARLCGVARLHHARGEEPEALLRLTAEHVQRSKFPGIPPLPKEVSSTITNARKVPTILEE